VAIDYSGRSLKAQLKQANRVNARYTLIVGEDEWSRGEGILRNMKNQEQQPFALTGSPEEQAARLIETVNTATN
jgi:histidyl-tRNA synthetase